MLSSILNLNIFKLIPSKSIAREDAIIASNGLMNIIAPKEAAAAPAITPSRNFVLLKGCFIFPKGPINLEKESPKAKIIMQAIAMSFSNNVMASKDPIRYAIKPFPEQSPQPTGLVWAPSSRRFQGS